MVKKYYQIKWVEMISVKFSVAASCSCDVLPPKLPGMGSKTDVI